jgi:hypothetical protein
LKRSKREILEEGTRLTHKKKIAQSVTAKFGVPAAANNRVFLMGCTGVGQSAEVG